VSELSISVIVPVLDEALRIGRCLDALARERELREVIVVDGGSRDGTVDLARARGTATVLEAPRGRARQMNAGARVAEGDVLLFLHADVSLPRGAPRAIRDVLSDCAVVAGAFRTWHVDDSSQARPAPWLHLADVRSRYSRLPYGDQAVFVRAPVFRRIGGYADLALMEDLELSLRLRAEGRIEIARASVRVSGRRFLAHPLRDTLLVNLMPLLFRAGVPASALASVYRHVR
jgi:rSAM/selenodomain-associated transferase 2